MIKKSYVLMMLGLVEAAPKLSTALPWSWTNVGISTMLALIGGGFMQLTRAEKNALPWKQAIGEWGLCAVAGFIVHAPAIERFSQDSIGMVWTTSVLAGCVGSKVVEFYCKRYVNPDA